MKPLIKWVGGKRRFIKIIEEKGISNFEFNDYYEPFAGSAALMFHLEPKNKIIINDLNENLINFYKAVQKDYLKVMRDSKKIIEDKKYDFYEIRQKYNETVNQDKTININFKEASYFFYLNKMGFNGMYRVNSSGLFNIPKGKSTSGPYIPTEEEFKKAGELLSRTEILHGDWSNSIKGAKKGDLIYLDPPYYPDESSSFIGYTNPSFGRESHEDLVKVSKQKVNKGCKVLISNSASIEFENLVKKYFNDDYKVIPISTKRSINPTVEDKSKFVETLYILGENNE